MPAKSKESLAVPAPPLSDQAIERVLIQGDLSKLTEAQCVEYYMTTCKSLGLNPLTGPFKYLILNGKKVLYATKDCTEQLRKLNRVSVSELTESIHEGVFFVKAKGFDGNGRADASTGAVSIKGLGGEALANAMMKAETKAKRRLTLSICGLGMLDETEIETIPGAQVEEPTLTKVITIDPPPPPPPAPKPVEKPAAPPKADIPHKPAPKPKPVETPKVEPRPAPPPAQNPTQRVQIIAAKTGCSTSNITGFMVRTLGAPSADALRTRGADVISLIGALEVTMLEFPKHMADIRKFICDEPGFQEGIASYFAAALANRMEK